MVLEPAQRWVACQVDGGPSGKEKITTTAKTVNNEYIENMESSGIERMGEIEEW